MPLPLLPLIMAGSAVTGVFNSWRNRKQSQSNTAQTIQANKEMAEYQYMKDMEQLEYMNEYNSPVNQRKRLEDAGLNPALMYKSAPQNVQTKMAEYNRPEIDYNVEPLQLPNPLQELAMFNDIRVKSQQANNLKATQDNIVADTILKTNTASKVGVDAEVAKASKAWSLEMIRESAQKKQAERVNEFAKNEGFLTDNAIKRMEYELKKADLELRKQGIYPGDPMYLRLLLKNKGYLQNYAKRQKELTRKFDAKDWHSKRYPL